MSFLKPTAKPDDEPPLTKQAAVANEFATYDEEALAKKLHDADARYPSPWDKVDPVYRERRIAQAHDLIELGYVQKINEYFGPVYLNLAAD